MKKITIISDGLVKRDYFVKALSSIEIDEEVEYHFFDWYGDLTKNEFQEKISLVEQNGPDFFDPPQDMLDALKETDYILAHIAPINEKMLSVCENLEFIGICRGGTENIDLEYCKKQEIPVIRMVKNATATAEFTVGLMFSLTRNIANSYNELLKSNWTKRYFNDGFRKNLIDMKIGIVGLGHVGTEVARILTGLGAEVYGYHKSITENRKSEINLPIHYTDLETVFKESDIVTLHMRLDSSSENLVNYDLLRSMRKDGYLINTARAGLINEKDLIRALNEELLLGVGLDVFWEEPLPYDHPLIDFENVLLTSHIAGDTDVIQEAPKMLIREVNKFLKNQYTPMIIKDKYMKNSF